jgi:hypothetical protein
VFGSEGTHFAANETSLRSVAASQNGLVSLAIVGALIAAGIGVSYSGQSDPASPPSKNCDPNYTGACVPNVDYDLNCADIGYQTVTVVGSDTNGFDADGDGIGCE